MGGKKSKVEGFQMTMEKLDNEREKDKRTLPTVDDNTSSDLKLYSLKTDRKTCTQISEALRRGSDKAGGRGEYELGRGRQQQQLCRAQQVNSLLSERGFSL